MICQSFMCLVKAMHLEKGVKYNRNDIYFQFAFQLYPNKVDDIGCSGGFVHIGA